MEKIYAQSQEELEFYIFKRDLKEQMMNSASDDTTSEEFKNEVEEANWEIRWIQQRIGDEERALNEAENALNYEISYDASIRSE
jgi:hypothetical protein